MGPCEPKYEARAEGHRSVHEKGPRRNRACARPAWTRAGPLKPEVPPHGANIIPQSVRIFLDAESRKLPEWRLGYLASPNWTGDGPLFPKPRFLTTTGIFGFSVLPDQVDLSSRIEHSVVAQKGFVACHFDNVIR